MADDGGLNEAVERARTELQEGAHLAQQFRDKEERDKREAEDAVREVEVAVRAFLQRVRAASIATDEIAIFVENRKRRFRGWETVYEKHRGWVVQVAYYGESYVSGSAQYPIEVTEDGTVFYSGQRFPNLGAGYGGGPSFYGRQIVDALGRYLAEHGA